MEVVHPRCAGIDVSKSDAKVCVRIQGAGSRRTSQTVRTWGAMTRQILELRDHLLEQKVTLVVMEATSDYWKPFYYLFEDAGFEVVLANPTQVRAIPGRKSDVSDAAWLADLGAHGLMRASFVPPPQIREVRDLVRARTAMVRERTREWQRLEKLLEDAGIKLSLVASRMTLVSTRRMLDALVAGERDPAVLADLALGALRKKTDLLNEALFGRFSAHHAFMVELHLSVIDPLEESIKRLEQRIAVVIEPFRGFIDLISTIPGVDETVAQVVLAEIGDQVQQTFPSPLHLASWAGVAPGMNSSAGRTKSTRARPGDRHLKGALGMAAATVARSKGTFLHAKYKRIAARGGTRRANVAVQHAILTAIWHMTGTGETYTDLGPDYHRTRNPELTKRRAITQLEALGLTVTLTPNPDAQAS
jgi:transposase